MKQLYFLFFLLFASVAHAQEPFITTWEVTSDDLEIGIYNSGNEYDYTIDFGDGTVQTTNTSVNHTYDAPGVYTVSITGGFSQLTLGNFENKQQILSVEQWGDIQWSSMEETFRYCSNLVINATDAPDLSQVTSLHKMFDNADSFNQSINHWDVSSITDMSYMFAGIEIYNQPLDQWDVSNVTNMSRMFNGATSFNQDISNWNVSSVTDMSRMFSSATSFDQNISDWDVSNVTDMGGMFSQTSSFNQDINNWDVSNVINMSNMFSGASIYDNPIGDWEVQNVTNMTGMFSGAASFNQNLNGWDVSNVIGMQGMFTGAISFNQPLNNWDVSSVTNMKNMFKSATSFNQNINDWNVSSVVDMNGMFEMATDFNQPLNQWDVSSVHDMEDMFNGANVFNQPINNWDVANVTTLHHMFMEADSFNQPLNNWDVSNVTVMSRMFLWADSFNQPLNNWNTANVVLMNAMFAGATSFNQPLNNWDVSNVRYMAGVFYEATSFDQDLSAWEFNFLPAEYHLAFVDFASYSGLSKENYDALLARWVELELEDHVLDAVGMEYCDEPSRNVLINNGWTIEGDSLAADCEGNLITGTIFYDDDNDGCDDNDIPADYMISASNGPESFATFPNELGEYAIYVSEGTYIIEVNDLSEIFNVTPENYTVTFDSFDNEENVEFCINADGVFEDLNVSIIPYEPPMPGLQTNYQLVVENVGNQTMENVVVSLVFDDNMQFFVYADTEPTTPSANELVFEFNTLPIMQSEIINFTMETFTPPTVNSGDLINFTAMVYPDINDLTPEDNIYELSQIAVNSCDPNDKQVIQGSEILLEQTAEYLDYLIRFQNTGTASAVNIRVVDTLHANLDWSTLRLTSSSHDYRVEITDGNHVEFIFDDIYLPHEGADEAGSNGFIAYKIKPVNDIAIGDIITGDAEIYFDFNEPIITNSADTEVVEESMGINEFVHSSNVKIYPNPTDDILYFNKDNSVEIEEVKIYSIQGQELVSFSQRNSINVENLSTGVYFIKISTSKGQLIKQFIKR